MAGSEVAKPAIGIDLGTTYSCVAIWKGNRVEIITNDLGNRTTPSCVAFTDDGRLIGDGARDQMTSNYANTVFDSKKMIGRRFSDAIMQDDMKSWPFKVIKGPQDMPKIVVTYMGHEKKFTTEEISSMVLTKMKEVAEAYIGETVKNAVITVPAYFNDCQRQATKDAATIAGLNVVHMINEPTAAAIAYGLDNQSGRKRNVLVFDLGGGTFDVSLLTIENGIFEVKAVAGDTHLGGQDFDNCLVEYCVTDLKNSWNIDITGNKKALGRLKTACEKAKRVLSYATQTVIEVDTLHNGIDFSMQVSRAKFEKLNMKFFINCIQKVETCLADANMQKRSVDEVILVGGSTRIPRIQCMLQEFFDGKELCRGINPDEAVACGAATMAAKLSGQTSKMLKELVLMDVTPLSLGTEIYGELMSVVIPRNTPIPTKKTDTFMTVADNQSFMEAMVYQGERTRSKDNYLLGQFTISGIPPAPKGESTVESCFEVDANGILTVTSTIVSTGKAVKLTVTNNSGRLSKQEVDKMVKDAERFKVRDKEYKRKVDAYNELEECLYVLTKKMKDYEMPAKRLKNMEYVIDDTTKWLSSHKGATSDEIEAKKEHLKFISNLVGRFFPN